tara:strand:- start:626 stop:1408 length:783 start_codon:yes stop_codon:yes gene_type:complete
METSDIFIFVIVAFIIYYIIKNPEVLSTNNNQDSASADGQGSGDITTEQPQEIDVYETLPDYILPVTGLDGTKLAPGQSIQSNELLPQGATVADNGGIQYTGDQLSAAVAVLNDRKDKGEVNPVENVTADKCKSSPCPPSHCTISNSIMEKTKKDPKYGASFNNYTGPFKCSNLDGTGTRSNCQPNTSTFCTAQGLANAQSPLCADSNGTTSPIVMCYCPPLKCHAKACNGTSKITNKKWACMSIVDETQCKADSACSWS